MQYDHHIGLSKNINLTELDLNVDTNYDFEIDLLKNIKLTKLILNIWSWDDDQEHRLFPLYPLLNLPVNDNMTHLQIKYKTLI